jgi:bifunctional UDP-N-acetylglucosamine pyrophosphorylase/glucosamine-1-phosphate N-acetyltransferase
VVILAAGEGKRMNSTLPKPLHEVAGRAMMSYILDATSVENVVKTIVVVGHQADMVVSAAGQMQPERALTFVRQQERLGTGHAVEIAIHEIESAFKGLCGDVLILPGDTPLLRRETIQELLAAHEMSGAALTILTATIDNPFGYGRIIHGTGESIEKIVEEKDATDEERAIKEVNTAIMVVKADGLRNALAQIGRSNAQGEYYLTDLVSVLGEAGELVVAWQLADSSEASGVNDPDQLAQAEELLKSRHQ